ncbi:hypothetical protein B7463_g11917, partial [Scytalidium lignicola]
MKTEVDTQKHDPAPSKKSRHSPVPSSVRSQSVIDLTLVQTEAEFHNESKLNLSEDMITESRNDPVNFDIWTWPDLYSFCQGDQSPSIDETSFIYNDMSTSPNLSSHQRGVPDDTLLSGSKKFYGRYKATNTCESTISGLSQIQQSQSIFCRNESTSDNSHIQLSLARPLNETSSVLVEYYFKEVASLFSSYDGHMNPFRTTVARLWQTCPVINYTLQSMAAACLSSTFRHLSREGLRLRRQVTTLLKSSKIIDDKNLLALIMLGQTTSWHNPHDLGISYFNSARQCLDRLLADPENLASRCGNNIQFFQEALLYWEMLLSYVTEDSKLAPSRTREQLPITVLPRIVPHPWTGFARDAQKIVQRVGIVVRRERCRLIGRRSMPTVNWRIMEESKAAEREASELEKRLNDLIMVGEQGAISPDDRETPVWHLLVIAEVYRRTGLVQIYNAFPRLLNRQVRKSWRYSEAHNSSILGQDICQGSTAEWQNFSYPSSSPAQQYLTSLALSTMQLLQSIPLESRTRCLQPFLLVASCSQLHLPTPGFASDSSTYTPISQLSQLSAHTIEISRLCGIQEGGRVRQRRPMLTHDARQSLNKTSRDSTAHENALDSNASELLTEETMRVYSQDEDIKNGACNELGVVVAVLATLTKTTKRTISKKGHDAELLKTILYMIQESRNVRTKCSKGLQTSQQN